MQLNDIAMATIKSDYIKTYLKGIEHVFYLEEQVSLIYNSDDTLKDKLDMLCKFKHIKETDEYKCNNFKEFKFELDGLIQNIKYIMELLNRNDEDVVITFESPVNYEIVCVKTLSRLEKYFKDNNIDLNELRRNISLCNTDTGEIVASVSLNSRLQPISFDINDKYNKNNNKLANYYINIPNDLKVGDVVTIYGDSSLREFVVVQEYNIPKQLENACSYSNDCEVTLIQKDLLDKNISYKKQIEDILHSRIQNIDNDNIVNDIISVNQEKVNITLIEK